MFKNNKEDIFTENLEKIYLSFFSKSIRVGIVGGGRAAAIKARTLHNKKIYTEVLAKDFSDEILSISNENLKLIKAEYDKNFIRDKHIIIIAVGDDELIYTIKKHCEDEYKIYINCSEFKDGMGVIPVQRDLENISFGLSTKQGNPKGALYAADLAFKSLSDIDEFIGFTGKLRNNIKNINNKREIIDFVVSDDFKFFWNKGKDKVVLKLFLNEDEVKCLYRCRSEVNGDSNCNKEECISSSSSR